MFYYFLHSKKSFSFLTFKTEVELNAYVGKENSLTIPNVTKQLMIEIGEEFIEEKGEYNDYMFNVINEYLKKNFNKCISTTTFRFNFFSEELNSKMNTKVKK